MEAKDGTAIELDAIENPPTLPRKVDERLDSEGGGDKGGGS
jgi:hypothetical protein